jgi:hypothetical protein
MPGKKTLQGLYVPALTADIHGTFIDPAASFLKDHRSIYFLFHVSFVIKQSCLG